jgi:hypothetical protein
MFGLGVKVVSEKESLFYTYTFGELPLFSLARERRGARPKAYTYKKGASQSPQSILCFGRAR